MTEQHPSRSPDLRINSYTPRVIHMIDIRRTTLAIANAAFIGWFFAHASPARAADPTGEWLVEDGGGKIRIEKCAGEMWGLISADMKPGTLDGKNPNPAERSRPKIGMPILLGMKQKEPNRWDGDIYNPTNGRTYSGSISLASADVLRVQGCVLGVMCGVQLMSRVAAAQKAIATAATGSENRMAGPALPSGSGVTQVTAFDSAEDVCRAAAAATGNPTLAGRSSAPR
jgi:uncharacterized protein (DUF2147 family)